MILPQDQAVTSILHEKFQSNREVHHLLGDVREIDACLTKDVKHVIMIPMAEHHRETISQSDASSVENESLNLANAVFGATLDPGEKLWVPHHRGLFVTVEEPTTNQYRPFERGEDVSLPSSVGHVTVIQVDEGKGVLVRYTRPGIAYGASAPTGALFYLQPEIVKDWQPLDSKPSEAVQRMNAREGYTDHGS